MIGLLLALVVSSQPAALIGLDNVNAEGQHFWLRGQYSTWGPQAVPFNCASETRSKDGNVTILACGDGSEPSAWNCISLVRENRPGYTRYFRKDCDGGVMGVETQVMLTILGTEITKSEYMVLLAQNVTGTALPCNQKGY